MIPDDFKCPTCHVDLLPLNTIPPYEGAYCQTCGKVYRREEPKKKQSPIKDHKLVCDQCG